jgi:hypothetical protein
MLYDFYIGLDLGQASDPTALCIVEEPLWIVSQWRASLGLGSGGWIPEGEAIPSGWVWPSELPEHVREQARRHWQDNPTKPPLRMPHLERLPLATSYPAIVKHVKKLLARPQLSTSRVALLVDYTGVGRPVFDMFVEAGLRPIGITITGGDSVHQDDVGWRVPKRDLVAAAQTVLQSGRLKISEALPDARTLQNELVSFKVKVNLRTGHDSYESWRSRDHDDLVLATALAVWYREWMSAHYDAAARARVASA